MTVLEVQVESLARLGPELGFLGALVTMGSASSVPEVNTGTDSPSMTAARAVSADVIPELRRTVADRFTTVGQLAQQVATRFAEVDGRMTEEQAVTTVTSPGSLLPPA